MDRNIEELTLEKKQELVNMVIDNHKLPIGNTLAWYLKQEGMDGSSADFFTSFRRWNTSQQLTFICDKAEEKGKWSDKVVTLCRRVADLQSQIETAEADQFADTMLDLFATN